MAVSRKATGRAKPAAEKGALGGRKPSVKYSAALAGRIFARIAGGETWSKLAGTDGMPSANALYQWAKIKDGFAEGLKEAREMAADRAADEVLEVARAATAQSASADRVKINALQWSAAKGAPHRYGARAESAVPKVEIVVRVKQFERVTLADGRVVVREILTEDGQ